MENRTASILRNTKETQIQLTLGLDGSGQCQCETGIGFLNHMLAGFAKHGLFDMTLTCQGDVNVDSHHTAEDVGLALGEALRTALGTKVGIARYGHYTLPMDDALVLCAIDLSGRAYYAGDVAYTVPALGGLDTEMLDEFFRAVATAAGMNLHLRQLAGTNNHHLAEASFKAFAKALDMATAPEPRMAGIWSTKGSL